MMPPIPTDYNDSEYYQLQIIHDMNEFSNEISYHNITVTIEV